MGLIGGDNNHFNHLLHFLVAAFVAVSFIIPLSEHPHNKVVAGVSAIGLAGSLVQSVYHLGIFIAGLCKAHNEEIPAGKVARNLLTSLLLSTAFVLLGVLAPILESDSNERTFNLIAVIALGVMRGLDLGLDFSHKDGESQGSLDRLKATVAIECPDDKSEIPFSGAKFFNARIVMVHLLLAANIVLTSIILAGENLLALGEIGKSTEADNQFTALVLISVHFLLYPIAFGSSLLCNDQCIKIMCGKGDDCETLEALNRLPLVRSLVAGVVIACLSYVVGSQLGNDDIQIAVLNLGLYLAADAIGRNVV